MVSSIACNKVIKVGNGQKQNQETKLNPLPLPRKFKFLGDIANPDNKPESG